MLAREKYPRILLLGVASTVALLIIWTSYFDNSPIKLEPLKAPHVKRISETASPSQIVEHIRANHLTSPSTKDYNLSSPGTHENSYSSLVLKILGNLTTGVFIEAGAYDGEDTSNSLPLELLGWKGILLECNPQVIPRLKSKNRKAWIADVCLSSSEKPGSIRFYTSPDWPQSAQLNNELTMAEMKVHGYNRIKNQTLIEHERPSFPLSSIIEAVGQFTQIDLLSLDVQGAEMDILKNFPYEKFPVKIIIAEVFTCTANQKKFFKKLMQEKGYRFYAGNGIDFTFVKN